MGEAVLSISESPVAFSPRGKGGREGVGTRGGSRVKEAGKQRRGKRGREGGEREERERGREGGERERGREGERERGGREEERKRGRCLLGIHFEHLATHAASLCRYIYIYHWPTQIDKCMYNNFKEGQYYNT